MLLKFGCVKAQRQRKSDTTNKIRKVLNIWNFWKLIGCVNQRKFYSILFLVLREKRKILFWMYKSGKRANQQGIDHFGKVALVHVQLIQGNKTSIRQLQTDVCDWLVWGLSWLVQLHFCWEPYRVGSEYCFCYLQFSPLSLSLSFLAKKFQVLPLLFKEFSFSFSFFLGEKLPYFSCYCCLMHFGHLPICIC